MEPSAFMISQITPPGSKSGHARQIDRGFGLPGADQHSALARAQRKHVTGTSQVARRRIRDDMATRMVCARSAAEIPVVTPSAASIDSQNAVPKRDVFMGEISGRCRASQRSGASARQISPRPCVAMKLMASGVTQLGGHGEVAFIFAIFIVDDDQHAAGAEIFDSFRDGRKGHSTIQDSGSQKPRALVEIGGDVGQPVGIAHRLPMP